MSNPHCRGQHTVAGVDGCNNQACRGLAVCVATCASCPDDPNRKKTDNQLELEAILPARGEKFTNAYCTDRTTCGCTSWACKAAEVRVCLVGCDTCGAAATAASSSASGPANNPCCRQSHTVAGAGGCGSNQCRGRAACAASCTTCPDMVGDAKAPK